MGDEWDMEGWVVGGGGSAEGRLEEEGIKHGLSAPKVGRAASQCRVG